MPIFMCHDARYLHYNKSEWLKLRNSCKVGRNKRDKNRREKLLIDGRYGTRSFNNK